MLHPGAFGWGGKAAAIVIPNSKYCTMSSDNCDRRLRRAAKSWESSLLGLLAKTAIASYWWKLLPVVALVFTLAGRILFAACFLLKVSLRLVIYFLSIYSDILLRFIEFVFYQAFYLLL